MTTDPIAAARAMISDAIDFACAANHHLAGQDPEQVQQWRDALATLADALKAERAKVAAAYEAAAALPATPDWIWRFEPSWSAKDLAEAIRALTPADAQAALDKMLAEARLEGWRAGRDAAAIAARGEGEGEWFNPVQAIRALPEPKESSHD